MSVAATVFRFIGVFILTFVGMTLTEVFGSNDVLSQSEAGVLVLLTIPVFFVVGILDRLAD